jgi:hypothetical protein
MSCAYIERIGHREDLDPSVAQSLWDQAAEIAISQDRDQDYAYINELFQSMIPATESANYVPDDFKQWYGLLPKVVQANTVIVDTGSLGQAFMLHIDVRTPKAFMPMMPRSAAANEDNTTPRVTVAPDIRGCIQGYGRYLDDMMWQDQNGIYINRLDFEYCLRPNRKLCYDAEASGEHWLVTYSPATKQYRPTQVGIMFTESINTARDQSLQTNVHHVVVLIEVTSDDTLRLDETIMLTRGRYRVEMDFTYKRPPGRTDPVPQCPVIKSCRGVSASEFTRLKSQRASIESVCPKPIYHAWS